MTGIRRHDPAYRRATLAMLAVGLATFNGLYCTQALLPTFTHVFGISPTFAALTISATTGAMALMIVPASILSERFGRGRVLVISLLLATTCGLISPFVTSAWPLVILRFFQGAFFAGTPAVAMAWLSEEMHRDDLPATMGIYIAGNTVGGLFGRLIPAGILEFASWRWAMGVNALVAFSMAVAVWLLLPRQRNFVPRTLSARSEFNAMITHWKNPRLAALFLIAFLAMGSFISVYNFLGFRLIDIFGLSDGLVGLLFVMYLAGTWSAARAGTLSRQFGRGPILMISAILMAVPIPFLALRNLAGVLVALFVLTASFFALHSVASSWVGLTTSSHRAEASSMYLFCYYLGSSIFGWASGFFFHISWTALTIWVTCLTLIIIALGAFLWRPQEKLAFRRRISAR